MMALFAKYRARRADIDFNRGCAEEHAWGSSK
jgi:hypothetical protein